MAKQKRSLWRWVCLIANGISVVLGVALGIEQLLSKVGALPGYRVVRVPVEAVVPRLYLFPAQKMRLSPEFQDGISQTDVTAISWTIRQGTKSMSEAGVQPTIQIPAGKGGLYEVQVHANVNGEKEARSGRTSFYVVQDDLVKIDLKEDAKVMLENLHFDQEKLRQRGAQIYFGKDTWIDAKEIRPEAKSVTIPGGQEIPTFDGKVFYRYGGASNELSDYGTAIFTKKSDVP